MMWALVTINIGPVDYKQPICDFMNVIIFGYNELWALWSRKFIIMMMIIIVYIASYTNTYYLISLAIT